MPETEGASTEGPEGLAVNQSNPDLPPQGRGEAPHFLFCVGRGGLLYLVASSVFASHDFVLPESPWLVVPYIAPFQFKPTTALGLFAKC